MERDKNLYTAVLSNIIVYAYTLFFAFFSIIGVPFRAGYLETYSIALLLLSLTGLGWHLFRKPKITLSEALIALFVVLVFISYLINDTRYGHNDTAQDTIEDFVARSIPAIICAIWAARKDQINYIDRASDFIIIVFTVNCSKIIIMSLFQSLSVSLWDSVLYMNYQNASYMAAYSVGLSLYKIVLADKRNTSLIHKILYIYSIIVCSIMAIYSGGRGGVVLIVAELMLIFAYAGFVQKRMTKTLRPLAIVLLLLLIFQEYLFSNTNILSGFRRAFEFLNPRGGINWEGTSGRYQIYVQDWNLFMKSPIWGHGVCGAPYNGIIRTHNIIFDILIDGGILYLLFWVLIIIYVFRYCLRKMKENMSYAIILVFFIGEFIMLNFSNVYMRTSAIWFAIAYVLTDSAHQRINHINSQG